jgi:hypothetical protein
MTVHRSKLPEQLAGIVLSHEDTGPPCCFQFNAGPFDADGDMPFCFVVQPSLIFVEAAAQQRVSALAIAAVAVPGAKGKPRDSAIEAQDLRCHALLSGPPCPPPAKPSCGRASDRAARFEGECRPLSRHTPMVPLQRAGRSACSACKQTQCSTWPRR